MILVVILVRCLCFFSSSGRHNNHLLQKRCCTLRKTIITNQHKFMFPFFCRVLLAMPNGRRAPLRIFAIVTLNRKRRYGRVMYRRNAIRRGLSSLTTSNKKPNTAHTGALCAPSQRASSVLRLQLNGSLYSACRLRSDLTLHT